MGKNSFTFVFAMLLASSAWAENSELSHGGTSSEGTVALKDEVFQLIDKSVQRSQLSQARQPNDFDKKCGGMSAKDASFADAIAKQVDASLTPSSNQKVAGASRLFGLSLSGVAEAYSAPDSMPSKKPDSDLALNAAPLCEVESSSPDAKIYNAALRNYNATIGKSDEASRRLQKKFWYAQMGCLADALMDDQRASVTDNVAQKKILGLFQFDAVGGNTAPCNDVWNAQAPEGCRVDSRNRPGFVKSSDALGSSGQSYNAFCGVQKVLQTFYIQRFSKKVQASCVSLAAPKKSIYNPFAPVKSVDRDEFKVMASCVAKTLGIKEGVDAPQPGSQTKPTVVANKTSAAFFKDASWAGGGVAAAAAVASQPTKTQAVSAPRPTADPVVQQTQQQQQQQTQQQPQPQQSKQQQVAGAHGTAYFNQFVSAGVPAASLQKSLDYLQSHPSKFSNKRFVAIADMSQPSTSKRLFILDLQTGQVKRYLVAHGMGSGVGQATNFSNRDGSHQTSLGIYSTGVTYNGEHGRSLELNGLENTNSNAASRAIVLHSAWYVDPKLGAQQGYIGRSQGCPAVSAADLPEVVNYLKGGALLNISTDG